MNDGVGNFKQSRMRVKFTKKLDIFVANPAFDASNEQKLQKQ